MVVKHVIIPKRSFLTRPRKAGPLVGDQTNGKAKNGAPCGVYSEKNRRARSDRKSAIFVRPSPVAARMRAYVSASR